ncbi:MAG: uroporphyrinogen decarboxylase family protein [Victivallales bacterium]|jgi:hypothetical protein
MSRDKLKISLNLMPSFFCKHIGTSYGERYYFDPAYRSEVERAEGKFLFDILGQFGVGSKDPGPSSNLFIQPIDLIKATLGADIYCPPDATLETHGHPWAAKSVAEIRKISASDAAQHSIVDKILKQYGEISRLYGDNADIFGIKSGRMGIHTPYTTAHQLIGEELFYMMVDEPESARDVFIKIWEIYNAVYSRLSSELRVPFPRHLGMGDCSACMLSEELYRKTVLPVNRNIAGAFQTASYHSCGGSTHLISAFSELPPLTSIELGPGTDLARAVQLMPNSAICPLVDPVTVRNGATKDVEALVKSLDSETFNAPAVTLCAWSLDRETPVANLQAIYTTIED